MNAKFAEYKGFDLAQINNEMLEKWGNHDTFHKSLELRKGRPPFVFYEGPPSANGMPGIHHVIARTIKDVFCRYKTMQGFLVERKAGWDTHGLPVELGAQKQRDIKKEDIGKTISIKDFNEMCRTDVMKYTDKWEDITHKMGYWVDMDNPYITYDNRYIETLWYLLSELYKKGYLYKDFTIQPYSPAAGTGLSSHELNYPGCYVDVKDTTCVALFTVIRNEKSEFLFKNTDTDVQIMAWTTTPWTLLSNTALAVGEKIDYVKVRTFNPYNSKPITVVLAKDLLYNHFSREAEELEMENYVAGDKKIPFKILDEFKGKVLNEVRYEQLLPYQQPAKGDAFRVLVDHFVTTTDGTGIVHIAPSFGADDFRVAKQNGVGSLTLVDKQGKFVDGVGEFSGRYVKNVYDSSIPDGENSVDVDIAVKLKLEGKAFKIEKYEHSYPHCWRTAKPILYYPLDAWFIRTTAFKDRLIELNATINWKPASTGSGRFGEWLKNLVDWNLSRSRFWGTPLPIWHTDDGTERICIGSVGELKTEIEKSMLAGFMSENPLEDFNIGDNSKANYKKFDLHRPFVDDIVLVSPSGKPMHREPDLIDVWFDSGAMPYAQLHYPFEHENDFKNYFPADFIAEGVDQTRGWFFTLHAISTMVFDSVAFKSVISNGLVLDAEGNKMSKSKGNTVDPFEVIDKSGSDSLRWYMMTNTPPWENLKFDFHKIGPEELLQTPGIYEVIRKYFGTLYNTYSFFALYANIDGFVYKEAEIPVSQRPEIDRWIISLLNTLVKDVTKSYEEYDPTQAGRLIESFVMENLSNWYVRLNRKRFWGGEYNQSKVATYQTLYTCLLTVAKLSAPISPFFMDKLFCDLNSIAKLESAESVHLSDFPKFDNRLIDSDLEERMNIAQNISSMVHALRRKVSIKVRQPLSKIIVPILDESLKVKIEAVKSIIINELNVKDIQYLTDTTGVLVKKIKANFKTLGPRYGKLMKSITAALANLSQQEISEFERSGSYRFTVDGQYVEMNTNDVEITSEDIPGWLVANESKLTVALDITITNELREEGLARELINRIQNLRKDSGFEVTDKIKIYVQRHEAINSAIENHKEYIGTQLLATNISFAETFDANDKGTKFVEIDEDIKFYIHITKN